MDQAKAIFEANLVHGYSKWKNTEVNFITPSKKEYKYQFLWDTAFHAIVLSHFDLDWAKREIENFLLGQREDGFLPHIIFWGNSVVLPHWAYIESALSLRPRTTAITQPPIFPIAVEEIYNKDKDKAFLKQVLDKLAANHRWFLENRDPDGDFLISIISPNESGLDELPVFQYVLGYFGNDPAKLHYFYRKPDLLNQLYKFKSKKILHKGYFDVEDLMFNCVFIESARALARLYRQIRRSKDAEFFTKVANKSEENLLKKCWDNQDEIFYSLYSKYEKHAKVKTIVSLMPLFLEGLDKKRAKVLVNRHLLSPKEFWTSYPLPTVSKDEPYYNPNKIPAHQLKLIWRGPTWINTNWFIVKGLRKHGFNDVADKIVDKTAQLIQKEGFREYYNPETGQGYSHKNFGWSTLIRDLL